MWAAEVSRLSPPDARAVIHEAMFQLVVPSFLAELIRGLVAARTGDTERATSSLTRVRELLDSPLPVNAQFPWEPDYRVLLAAELAALART